MMKPLLPPDAHHFNAASGWHDLGNPAEARAELKLISAENQSHPYVIELRWLIAVAATDWNDALTAARELLTVSPDEPNGWLHCAYAVRRARGGGVEHAWQVLEPAADKFPEEPVIPFNLACYACQLNKLDDARKWFERACKVGGTKRIKAMALADDDLKPLWPEIKSVK